MTPTQTSLWQQIYKPKTAELLSKKQEKVKARLEKWKAHPNRLKFIFGIFVLFPVLFVGSLILFETWRTILFEVLTSDDDGNGIFALFLIFMPAIAYYGYIKKTQVDALKMFVAEKMGWQYDPNEDRSDWQNMRNIFPKLFEQGNTAQDLQDQFWGMVEDTPFWSGIFHYGVETRDSKGRKHTTHHYKYFYAFPLPQVVKHQLYLKPEQKFLGFGKDIDTESVKFNKMFQVEFDEDTPERQMNIVKTLSPSVLIRLTDIGDSYGKYSLLIRGDTVIFLFDGKMLRKMKTNFILKGVQLDPRDQARIEAQMKQMISAARELFPFLK